MLKKAVNKKQKLLARKEELLNELKYYERRIEEERSPSKSRCSYDADSSDSEIEFNLDTGPSLSELKQEKAQLKTCLLATQELTELTVVQSEVNMLVDPPSYVNEGTVTEEGTWREVMAECRIDLVPFTISFYTHQPSRPFAAMSYRGLSVMPTKLSQEKELQRSVLPTLASPSDALEVLRKYAMEHRARRTTLSQLADKYGDSLYMEQSEEGGYTVRCADLLEMSWTLQNKLSPVARFRHKMKFDLEYMDEHYVKEICQAHKALGDPALDTDGRTLLLMKIIDTCLEAKRLMGPAMDPQGQPSDQDSDVPAHSGQIMGPPKSLPKKTKRKGKENVATNDVKKERNTNDESSEVKKSKTDAAVKKSNCIEQLVEKTAKDIEGLKNTKSVHAKDSVETKNALQPSTKYVAGAINDKNNAILKPNENKKVAEKELKAKDGSKKVVQKSTTSENQKCVENKDLQVKPVANKAKDSSKKLVQKSTTSENQKCVENKDSQVKPVAKKLKLKASVGENEQPAKKSKISVANIDKKAENPKNVEIGIKKTENNQVLKLNTKKESLKKTSNVNSKPNIVQKSNNIPTLSERFKNKMNTNNIVKSSINKNTNEVRISKELKSKNLIKTTEKSNKLKIDKLDRNALKSELNSKNKLNQKPYQNTLKLNSKLNINNNQNARKSPRLKIVSSGNVANKIISKIPLRISPRAQMKAATTKDSSKTSKHTNPPAC